MYSFQFSAIVMRQAKRQPVVGAGGHDYKTGRTATDIPPPGMSPRRMVQHGRPGQPVQENLRREKRRKSRLVFRPVANALRALVLLTDLNATVKVADGSTSALRALVIR
jgi:hypothetical protein